ncbi:MAG: squalene/phytoene synthase family protein [Candidatus Dormiibacterota bacterium]
MSSADAYCRRLLRGHYENFWVSSPLVPRALRLDLARVYAYCRTVDDLGDESAGPEDAEGRLAIWRSDLEQLFAGGTPTHPVLVSLRETVRAHTLPPQPFFDLIEANRRDQRVTRYDDWPALLDYCRHSATPVGRLVLHLFGAASPALLEASDDVCVGLQLANFAQDVGVDAALGRTYLLQEEIAGLGMPGAVRAMCERAAALLRSGHRLEAATRGRLRVQLALYRLGGEAILDAVARAGYRTDQVRPTVSRRRKVGLLGSAVGRGTRKGDRDEQHFRIA